MNVRLTFDRNGKHPYSLLSSAQSNSAWDGNYWWTSKRRIKERSSWFEERGHSRITKKSSREHDADLDDDDVDG